jgi:hypothetical protein
MKSAAKTTAKSSKERRRMKRWKVAVLVRCSVPKFSSDVFEMEMWAKDVNEKGMQLEWSRGLTVSHVNPDDRSEPNKNIRFEDMEFTKGSKILVQDLFYDDEGSPFLEGKISWVRRPTSEGNWGLGVEFAKGENQSKELLSTFKDFLSIIKNPTAAIAKASRKK